MDDIDCIIDGNVVNLSNIWEYIDKDEKENHIETVQEICTQIHDSHIYDEDDYKK